MVDFLIYTSTFGVAAALCFYMIVKGMTRKKP